jgi:TolA-binding protein
MSREEALEDLLIRARRYQLEEEEEKRLEVAVQSSRELEVLYRAGVQFDAGASLLAGDEARLDTLVRRTLARLDQGSAPAAPAARARSAQPARSTDRALAVRYFAASLAFSLLLSVALANAWDYVEKRETLARTRAAAARATEVARAQPQRATPRAAPAPTLPPPASEAIAAPAVPGNPFASSLHTVPVAAPPRQPSAPLAAEVKPIAPSAELDQSQLFAQANALRRQGDSAGAIALYERLRERYPSSAEAEDAQVLLGKLLLAQSSARAALQKFESYGSGALTLEALWGKAQALRTLGSAEERSVLETLVRDYPSSPYAPAARKRLQALPP